MAIPVLNGGRRLEETLAAVVAQRLDRELELIVCDSGSSDGSAAVARRHGATVLEIARADFSHGGTRNLLMQQSAGEHVAFLTQDSEPAGELWLSRLLAGFSLSPDVGLVFGPYEPRIGTSPMVARELAHWFSSFSPQGELVVDRLSPDEPSIPSRALLGRRGYFTDANGCLSRRAWERVPFREVPYAEDHVLAHDMLRAGFAKVFSPEAAVIHSHEYNLVDRVRRSFDEARALREVYGWIEPLAPRVIARNLWGNVGSDRRWAIAHDRSPQGLPSQLQLLVDSTVHHLARATGTALGGRADRLPRVLRARLSLEGRPG